MATFLLSLMTELPVHFSGSGAKPAYRISLGLKGVKLHPDFQNFEADSPCAMSIFELCAEAGLPVLVHTGDYRFDYSNPNRIANVLRAFPKLKFVGAHFGGWSVWDEADGE